MDLCTTRQLQVPPDCSCRRMRVVPIMFCWVFPLTTHAHTDLELKPGRVLWRVLGKQQNADQAFCHLKLDRSTNMNPIITIIFCLTNECTIVSR